MNSYIIQKLIGQGAYGKVHLALRKEDKKLYAIKEIPFFSMKEKAKEDARNEVALLSKLKHPYIISYYDSFYENGRLLIVMDYCEGGDLTQMMNAQKHVLFEEPQILDWFTQICLAIKFIHDKNILHRDIKCQNIFLHKTGVIKLGDFGIAKILHNPNDLAKTAIGTPYYLSPEICQNVPYNNKSDIWALGCVLYELLTLRHPFESNNMKNLISKIVRSVYPPLPGKYSYDLRNLVTMMLKKTPRERPDINRILAKKFIYKQIRNILDNYKLKTVEIFSTPVPAVPPKAEIKEEPPKKVAKPPLLSKETMKSKAKFFQNLKALQKRSPIVQETQSKKRFLKYQQPTPSELKQRERGWQNLNYQDYPKNVKRYKDHFEDLEQQRLQREKEMVQNKQNRPSIFKNFFREPQKKSPLVKDYLERQNAAKLNKLRAEQDLYYNNQNYDLFDERKLKKAENIYKNDDKPDINEREPTPLIELRRPEVGITDALAVVAMNEKDKEEGPRIVEGGRNIGGDLKTIETEGEIKNDGEGDKPEVEDLKAEERKRWEDPTDTYLNQLQESKTQPAEDDKIVKSPPRKSWDPPKDLTAKIETATGIFATSFTSEAAEPENETKKEDFTENEEKSTHTNSQVDPRSDAKKPGISYVISFEEESSLKIDLKRKRKSIRDLLEYEKSSTRPICREKTYVAETGVEYKQSLTRKSGETKKLGKSKGQEGGSNLKEGKMETEKSVKQPNKVQILSSIRIARSKSDPGSLDTKKLKRSPSIPNHLNLVEPPVDHFPEFFQVSSNGETITEDMDDYELMISSLEKIVAEDDIELSSSGEDEGPVGSLEMENVDKMQLIDGDASLDEFSSYSIYELLEMKRGSLEKSLGLEKLIEAYKYIMSIDEIEEKETTYQHIISIIGSENKKHIFDIFKLVNYDTQYYENLRKNAPENGK